MFADFAPSPSTGAVGGFAEVLLQYLFVARHPRLSERLQIVLHAQEVATPFYIVSYFIKWFITSWTYSIMYTQRLAQSTLRVHFPSVF